MEKGYGVIWRRLGRMEKAFLFSLAFYALLYSFGWSPGLQILTALAASVLGVIVLFRLARRGVRKAIWRLRNRLIVAYLFIAVVPIFLILSLVVIAGKLVIGQVAIQLVTRELEHRAAALLHPAEGLAGLPLADTETALNRFSVMTRSAFPLFELRMDGRKQLSYPPGTSLTQPPAEWGRASGLLVRKDEKGARLYAWAHVRENGNEVSVVAPITNEWLADLVPGLGEVSIVPLTGHARLSRIPPPMNAFDFQVNGIYPMFAPSWDSPKTSNKLELLVITRVSSVLGIVFGENMKWGEVWLDVIVVVSVLFLLVEIASLVTGIQLTRTITGAVHEIYEGTQHVNEGDFSYRIPVKGGDQLAELGASFNTMTSNLGRLIVVAKEKERLESELAIAREVQDQLFPRDVPFTRTLELKGVCNPARMVSGDYYDFMPISDTRLAFAIGDVAGKGISAALLMATIQSTMRTQLGTSNGAGPQRSTASMVSTLNRQLYANTAPEKYATFYFAMYDEATNELTYTNAGHLAPILLRGSTLEMLGSTGTVVGAFPTAQYQEKTLQLQHGDILVAYTDGIVEPENPYGEMFGEERLKDLIVKYVQADSSEIIARTMEAVTEWTGSSELQDDMTMVLARRL
jgi:sigma-B regulation protein RsbU (phosphoserine phosphatase)